MFDFLQARSDLRQQWWCSGPLTPAKAFNFSEGQLRHRPRDLTPTSLRLGESLRRIRMPNPFCRLGSGTGRPFVYWKRSGPLGSSHCLTPTSSHGTQLLSTRVSQDGQLMLRQWLGPLPALRHSPRTPDLIGRGAYCLKPHGSGMTTPRCGWYCHAWKTWWKTASTSSRFTASV